MEWLVIKFHVKTSTSLKVMEVTPHLKIAQSSPTLKVTLFSPRKSSTQLPLFNFTMVQLLAWSVRDFYIFLLI
jgi:hypothetical protein